MKGIELKTIRDTRQPDRKLEIMLGAACLMLAAACLILAIAVGWRLFLSSPKTATSAGSSENAAVAGSTPTSVSAGQGDLQIQNAIAQQFHNASCCDSLRKDNVLVNVRGGMVTLLGNVPSLGDRNSAEFLARIVAGVKGIDNEIVVSSTSRENAQAPTVERHRQTANGIGRTQKSAETLRPSRESDQSAELRTWVDLGNTSLNNGDYAGAIRYFNLALALDPQNKDAIAGMRRAKSAQRAEETIIKRSA